LAAARPALLTRLGGIDEGTLGEDKYRTVVDLAMLQL